jgi:hypothetical protein
MRSSREGLERLTVTANDKVATVLGSIPASSDTVESEWRQMKQCWIKYIQNQGKLDKKHSQIISTLITVVYRYTGEYWMIYRGPGFLGAVWFDSSPTPYPPLQSASCLSFPVILCVPNRAHWRERWVGGGGREAKSDDCEEVWPSINHSILSAVHCHLWSTLKCSCIREKYRFCRISGTFIMGGRFM